jgi:hypothetical protein
MVVGETRKICQVTDVTEGEGVDLYDKLMEMTGWTVTDEDKQE